MENMFSQFSKLGNKTKVVLPPLLPVSASDAVKIIAWIYIQERLSHVLTMCSISAAMKQNLLMYNINPWTAGDTSGELFDLWKLNVKKTIINIPNKTNL